MEITFLGTTAGLPTKKRAHPAIALRYQGDLFLFDCGENAQRQMMLAGLSPMKLKAIFLTHWHFDHSLGLAGLMETLSLLGRTEPLEIYGPKGTKSAIKHILKIGYEHKLNYKLNVNEVERGEVYKGKNFKISCIPVKHSVLAIAYKFVENDKPGRFKVKEAKKLGLKKEQYGILQKGKPVKVGNKTIKPEQVLGPKRPGIKIVYSGDTLPLKALEKFAKNVNLLIHEATFADEMKDYAKERFHATASQAATIAKNANVKQLILTHISPRYKTDSSLLKEARKIFKNTKIAKDFMKIEIK